LPKFAQVYEKYHSKGLEIVGISLDPDPQRAKDLSQANNLSWQQYCDGKGWASKLVLQYGILTIPATFLLDRDGRIIARDLRASDLDEAVGKALSKN